ncbi:putative major facilitator superfamily protein [Eutypa lata UCREL1]|uniref:Putative major facilitator superfamily protein n=1 Tax=Eutypa lata (strain UCR-EL1) TaxID=1287681 RepID=M7TET2_EUTLA|nr:putative major facilitator superfamily protein [Eutypa lata UCREL1]
MAAKIPPFEALPLRKDGPPGNAWGLFGDDDQLGRLNLLTPEVVKAAAGEIQVGTRISLDWDLDKPKVPGYDRQTFRHRIINKAPSTENDDAVEFNTQGGSQWDGLRHFDEGYQNYQTFYNGRTQEDFKVGDDLGINVWVDNGGIVGRGVLLDWADWAAKNGIDANPFRSAPVELKHLEHIVEERKIEFRSGDILFIRVGFTKAYDELPPHELQDFFVKANSHFVGLEATKDSLRWLWEKQFAAVASDSPAFERGPVNASFNHPDVNIHQWCLGGWGLPIGELFDLEKLAQECRRLDRWSFFVSSIPLKSRDS